MKKPVLVIRVKELRRQNDLTQEQLAELLGISRQSIIALENGRYMPSLPLACEIAKFFDVALDQLLSLDMNRFFDEEFSTADHLVSTNVPVINVRQDRGNVYLDIYVSDYKKNEINVEIENDILTVTIPKLEPETR